MPRSVPLSFIARSATLVVVLGLSLGIASGVIAAVIPSLAASARTPPMHVSPTHWHLATLGGITIHKGTMSSGEAARPSQ